jgi:excisionase family DNA binding protein
MRAIKGCGVSAHQDQTLRNVPTEEHNSILAGMPPLLTVEEAASILRLSPGRCRTACREGRIPAFQIGGRWRVPRARLETLLTGAQHE